MSDIGPESDADLDLFSFAALQRAPDAIRPTDIPPAILPATESHQPYPPPIPATEPTAVNSSEPPKAIDRQRQQAKRIYPTKGSVPEISDEALARSPKLRQWRERERNKINARAYRARERAARDRVVGSKLKVCRACFRLFPPTEKRLKAPYCTTKCQAAWAKVQHCFDGEAAWLYRIGEARRILARPAEHNAEARLASEHLLSHAAPDYSPYEPRPGTLLSALARSLGKLREKWAPYAAEALRSGRADSLVRPDMMKLLGPLIRGDIVPSATGKLEPR